jgi:hypothetical protein
MSSADRKLLKVDPYFEGEPHPLPLTRAWVEDYKRPSADEGAAGPPDLLALVECAGRRFCASIGEEYVEDPFKRPQHQGGYQHITAEEWAEYDRALAAWQRRRRGL